MGTAHLRVLGGAAWRSLPELKDLLGHATLQMTMRYAHLAPENLRRATAALDGVLDASAPALEQIAQELAQEQNGHPSVSPKCPSCLVGRQGLEPWTR
jgi:hypothetical protein